VLVTGYGAIMSIIEKAVDKLERAKPNVANKRESDAPGTGDTLEQLVSAKKAERGVVEDRGYLPQQIPKTTSVVEPVSSSPAVVSPVVELPFAALSDRGILTPLTPRSQIAEEFRTIKRPLLRNIDGASAAPVSNANLVMVTSALQGDGKTFTAINLALSIAMEQDKTVLFVDADVAKASAGGLLGVPPDSKGLIDVLEDKDLSLRDVILATNIENLKILPAGNVHERSTELLASKSMKELMLEMASRYSDRVILFDSPPLLLTTEASVLASFMGQIAFVVSTDQTPSQAVTEALEHIGEDKIIGMILNKAHQRRSKLFGLGYGYGYGSGYGYGYGYGSDQKGRAASGGKSG
jgi:protein-tyrosine kinase